MSRFVERHRVGAFLLLTFSTSWTLWLASGVPWRSGAFPPDARWLTAQVGVFAPALSALAIGAVVRPGTSRAALRVGVGLFVPAIALGAGIASRGFPELTRVEAPWTALAVLLAVAALAVLGRGSNRVVPWPLGAARARSVAVFSLGALLVPVAVLLAGWALSTHAGGARTPLPAFAARSLTAVAVVEALGINLVYGGSLGEEPGWRGFLLPELLRDRTPFGASLVIGFWWALWHAPLDYVQGFAVTGFGGLVARQVWTLPLAVLFTWVTLRAGGSLLPAIAFHTGLNAIPDFALADPGRYESAVVLFFVASLVAAAAVCVADTRMLRRPESEAVPFGDSDRRRRTPP